MLRENLIFRTALVVSAAIHIGGFGLLKGNSHFFRNGLTGVKDSVVVFEIGWIESPAIQGKIDGPRPCAQERGKQNENGELKIQKDKECISSFSHEIGSSGNAEDNKSGVTDEYLQEVRKRIESVKFYPVEARRRLISGSVTISFDIDKSGISKNINIVKSSGFPLLDNTAKEMVLKANPFPKPPASVYSSHYIQTTIVFEF